MTSAPNIQRPSKRSMSACVGILAAITWTLWLGAVSVFAQPAPNGLLVPGNAAVSGFSGAIGPAQVAPGVNPLGFTFIDLNGPSLRVVDLQNMRAPPSAQLVKVPKPFTILAAQIGQVFAVALDNAVPPNIYAAATSAYGLHIARPGNDGLLTHARIGAPNTTFMPGMWGQAAPGGGPGSIWKIDGVTGAVNLFANVQLNGIANSGPALGGLVFDPDSNSFFVADRETGFIHRFSITGAEIGRYDHGVQGRTAQGLPAVAFDPAKRLNITSAVFNATQPATWNYTAPERRVFGLAVHNSRLYYAVAESQQIWSVAIGPQDFTDPVLELSAPPGSGPSEISKITFDDQGRMLLAERPDPTGAEDFRALTQKGAGRLLRYTIAAIYPGLPRAWQAVPDDYAIGFPGSMTNGNGGVALGFDYDRTGRIDRGSCGGFLWATGEQLRRSSDPPIAERLSQSGPANVDGLQGDYIWTIRPNNTPPLKSYFIDYDDRFDDDAAWGHLGDVAVWRICGPALRGGWMLPSWFAWAEDGGSIPLPPVLSCPVDQQKPGFQCCPKGTSPGPNGQCKPWCPNGKMDSKSQNLCGLGFDAATDDPNNPAKIKCIGGATPSPGKGILGCADHSPVLNPAVCQAGWAKQNVPNIGNICQPTKTQMQCPPGQQVSSVDNKCHALCLGGTAWPSQQCCATGSAVTPTGQCCPPGATVDPKTGTCSKLISVCPKDSKPNPKTGVCEPPGKACPAGSTPDPKTGACAKLTTPCLPGLSPDPVTGECKKAPPKLSCSASQQSSDGQCCKAGWSPNNAIGGCCPPGQSSGPNGACKITACFAPNKQVSGKCCSPSDLKPGGSCANTLCGIGNAPAGSNNACCGAERIYTGKNGVQACCPSPLVDGQCMPAKGTPMQPQCSPGSTDPNCCAAGYKWAGASCCLASQLTSKGQCCPAGQKPSGPDQAQCQPDLKTGIPPYNPGNPGSSTTVGKCCMTGLIPIASGICCAPNQVTSAGVCCPAGQAPDPKNRRVCVPVQTCGLRETLVNGACCSNSNLYTDASGRSQCCGQLVDPLTNVCPGPAVGDLPQCFAGYTRTSDGSCCANNLVTRDGRCLASGKPSQLVPVVPVPPSVRMPREMVPPAQSPRPPHSTSQQPRPPAPPTSPPQARPGLPPAAVRPMPNQLRPMPMFRPPIRPALPQQRCMFINGREVCR